MVKTKKSANRNQKVLKVQDTVKKSKIFGQPKFNWSIAIIVVCLAVILLLVRSFKGKTEEFKKKQIPDAIKKVLSDPSTKFEITSVTDKSGIYEFVLRLNNQDYTSYITKDAKLLFTSGVELDKIGKQAANGTKTEQKKVTCNDIQKAEKEQLTAFVVSNCPYGIQMQRVFKKAIAENPTLSTHLDIKYIGTVENGKITSMHGNEEAQENLKQICIREEQNELYWPYVSCYMEAGKADECLVSSGVDKAKLDGCTADSKRGIAFAQADFDMATKMGVSGSPTLIVNGKQVVSEYDFGGRVPNSIQKIVCCGSKSQDASCSTDLSTQDLAPSFSQTDEAAEGSATDSSAGCAPAQ